ncbi:MAG TPA: hypothetical protein VFD90_06550 [Gaiellales bacterium]|nr:hypothetical protein [Gaiellales bacterium]
MRTIFLLFAAGWADTAVVVAATVAPMTTAPIPIFRRAFTVVLFLGLDAWNDFLHWPR